MQGDLAVLRRLANLARFDEFLTEAARQVEAAGEDAASLLGIGREYLSFGYLSLARPCFERAAVLLRDDPTPGINLTNVAMETGDHTEARRLYRELLVRWPNQATLARNALMSYHYDPTISEATHLMAARDWGAKALGRTRGMLPRPPMRPLAGRPLRIGYVSADFCNHTVGQFLRKVLEAHDPARVTAYAYAHIKQDDEVTAAIRKVTLFADITALDHQQLAEQIRADEIDVLVDLSGHTAGSKLLSFVYRPAPVMVSWLGYYATTGLPVMDAVLLDEWHAPPGTETQFVEPIIRLPGGRFCYTPPDFMPAVAPLPVMSRGHVTFGSFNNTAKLNEQVFDVWAEILRQVADSRLILKWRTFQDDAVRDRVSAAFASRGIDPARLELRGASFHLPMLKEYGDVDIALDPFPFTGGMTSCEALYSGVPVVTWPQAPVVSRQTDAFLHQIGLPELAAKDADDYVRIAVELANNPQRLMSLRQTLRQRMQASSLCDVAGFTRKLEDTLIQLYENIAQSERIMKTNPKTLLNVGAGHPQSGAKIPVAFQSADWREVRLDIDPANEPDILGTMLDMSVVESESVDAIYSSHNIEHLYPDEIPQAMREFLRVLKPEGFAVITCPDLQAAAQMIAEDKLLDPAYTTGAGMVITPFDIVYSHREFTGRDKPYMAHHCGFTLKVLIGTLRSNGFASVAGKRRMGAYDLWVVASKSEVAREESHAMARKFLPA